MYMQITFIQSCLHFLSLNPLSSSFHSLSKLFLPLLFPPSFTTDHPPPPIFFSSSSSSFSFHFAVLLCLSSRYYRSSVAIRTPSLDLVGLLMLVLPFYSFVLLFFPSDGRYWVLPSGELLILSLTATDAYSRVSCRASHAFDNSPRASNTARVIVTG